MRLHLETVKKLLRSSKTWGFTSSKTSAKLTERLTQLHGQRWRKPGRQDRMCTTEGMLATSTVTGLLWIRKNYGTKHVVTLAAQVCIVYLRDFNRFSSNRNNLLNQIKSLLLSHHHSTSALVSEILMSVLQTVQKKKQFTYGQYIFTDCTEDNVQNTHTYTQYT